MSLANKLIIAILVSSAVHIVLSKKSSESDESTVDGSRSSKEDDKDSDDGEKSHKDKEKSFEDKDKSSEDKDKSNEDNENDSKDEEKESEAIENESKEKDDSDEQPIAREFPENDDNDSKVFIDLTLKAGKKLFDDDKTSSSIDSDSDYKSIDTSRPYKKFNFMGIVRQKFGVKAVQSYSKNGIPKDMVCSPISALLPLGKLSLGATGLAFRELSKAIGLSTEIQIMDHFKNLISGLKNNIGVELTIASQLFVSKTYPIRKEYTAKLSRVFDTPVEMVDFTTPGVAARAINKWVKHQTHGRIQNLASSSAENYSGATLAIVNAVFFRGEWMRSFKKSDETDFYAYDGKKKTKFMKRKGTYKYTKSSKLSSKVVQIPYSGDEASFVVILPNSKLGLKSLMRKFEDKPALLMEVIEKLKFANVDILLPKFKIDTRLQITDTLDRIGVSSIFKKNGGLNGIAADDLYVSSAIQAAIIEVNEKGTMAAAATGIQMEPVSLMLHVKSFNAQHPFYFLVMSKGEQLFSGAYFGSEIS